jgi:hypothetical protein
MSYCDIVLIIRGYRRRNILQYQLQRIQAYGSLFAMSGDKQNKGPEGWIPLYFDNYKKDNKPPLSDEDRDKLIAEMNAINAQLSKKAEE